MPKPIEIAIPIEEIEARKQRAEKAKQFGTPDRVPVIPAIPHRFLIPKVGVKFRDYYSDPETMLRTQILAQKWLMENIRTDAYSITGIWVSAWTDDLAVGLSAKTYREIVLPYEKKLRFHFDGYVCLNMCGRTDHLLKIFREELQINEYQGFGYEVDLDWIGEVMGGRIVLIGNVNPMLIHFGTPEQVREATRNVIEKLVQYKGFIVQDGNNITPGSPVENINAMMEAAERYGKNY